jgi:hypothetical protein
VVSENGEKAKKFLQICWKKKTKSIKKYISRKKTKIIKSKAAYHWVVWIEEDHLLTLNIFLLTDSAKYRKGMFEKNRKYRSEKDYEI